MKKPSLYFFSAVFVLLTLSGCRIPTFGNQSSTTTDEKIKQTSVHQLSSSAAFETFIAQADKPVLVKFGAPWCSACQEMNPVLENISYQTADRYLIAEINIDQAPDLAERFEIKGIPLMCLFNNGKEIAPDKRLVGFVTADDLLTFMNSHLN